MSNVTYIVRTVYKTEGLDRSGADARAAGAGFDALGTSMKSVEGFIGQVKGAIAGLAGVLTIKAIGSAIVDLSSKAEDTRIAIAGMMQGGVAVGTSDDFQMSMAMSSELIQQMKKDARDLPGEFQDLMNVFRGGGLRSGLAAGRSVMESEQMSARLMSFSTMQQMPSDVAGREFGMMMEGRAGAHNTLWQLLKRNIGKTSEEFNALAAPAKWALIDKALKGYDPAIKAVGESFGAISSATTDYAKEAFGAFSNPVFEVFKGVLSDINAWYEKHRDQVKGLAKIIGEGLAAAISRAWDFTKRIGTALAAVDWGGVAGAVKVLVGALAGYYAIVGTVTVATWAWEVAQVALDIAMTANPIGIILVALAALIALIIVAISYVKELRLEFYKMLDSDFMQGLAHSKVGGKAIEALGFGNLFDRNLLRREEGKLQREIADQEKRGRGGFLGHVFELLDPGGKAGPGAFDFLKKFNGDQKTNDEAVKNLNRRGVADKPQLTQNNYINQRFTINESGNAQKTILATKRAFEQALQHPIETPTSHGTILR